MKIWMFLFPHILVSESSLEPGFRVEFKDGVVSKKKGYKTDPDEVLDVLVGTSPRSLTYCYVPDATENAGTLWFIKKTGLTNQIGSSAKSFIRTKILRKDAPCRPDVPLACSGGMYIDYTLQTVTFSGDNKGALQKMVKTIRSNLSRFPDSSWENWKMQMCFPDNTVQFEGSDLEYDYDPNEEQKYWPVEQTVIQNDLNKCSEAIETDKEKSTPRYFINREINYDRLASIWCRVCKLTGYCSVEDLSPYFQVLEEHYEKLMEHISIQECRETNALRREILHIRSLLNKARNKQITPLQLQNKVRKAFPADTTYLSIIDALPVLVPRRKRGFLRLPHLDYFKGPEGLEARITKSKELEDLYDLTVQPYLDVAYNNIILELEWCEEILQKVQGFINGQTEPHRSNQATSIENKNVLSRISAISDRMNNEETISLLTHALPEIWPKELANQREPPYSANPPHRLEFFTRLKALVRSDEELNDMYQARVLPYLKQLEVPTSFPERVQGKPDH